MATRTRKTSSTGGKRTSGEERAPETPEVTDTDVAAETPPEAPDSQPSAPADGPDTRPAYRPGMEPK